MIDKEKLQKIIHSEQQKRLVDYKNLTNREKEIIRLWTAGLTSQEMAIKLKVSKNTIDTHRKNIYKKTSINSTMELLFFALAFDLYEGLSNLNPESSPKNGG